MESGPVRRIPTPEEEKERLSRAVPPYPEGYEEDVSLKDGTRLHLRPIRPDDGPRLLGLYDKLSNTSLFHRFFAVPQKDASKADYLARVDYENQFALVAELGGEVVAVARYHRDPARPDHAEVAFTVADALQGKGIGTLLFDRLAGIARAHRVAVFDAEVLKDNIGMIRVFEKSASDDAATEGTATLQIQRIRRRRPSRPIRPGMLPAIPRYQAVSGSPSWARRDGVPLPTRRSAVGRRQILRWPRGRRRCGPILNEARRRRRGQTSSIRRQRHGRSRRRLPRAFSVSSSSTSRARRRRDHGEARLTLDSASSVSSRSRAGGAPGILHRDITPANVMSPRTGG
jgi:RimJ/RimL family protein N-acetyltransferase